MLARLLSSFPPRARVRLGEEGAETGGLRQQGGEARARVRAPASCSGMLSTLTACLLGSRCFLLPPRLSARYSSQVCSRGFNPTSGAPLFQLSSRPLLLGSSSSIPSPRPMRDFCQFSVSSPHSRCSCARRAIAHMYSAPRVPPSPSPLTSRTSSSVLLSSFGPLATASAD
jgi:hypothetical protein